jgi:hypothetical protein
MLAPLHRFFDRLFHGHHTAHLPLTPPDDGRDVPVRSGIPDAYLDKLPPAEERVGERHYTRDSVSHHFVETADLHNHADHR